MENSDGKEDGSRHKKTPRHMSKAKEDVSQPCKET
jgi:hypothetical protein